MLLVVFCHRTSITESDVRQARLAINKVKPEKRKSTRFSVLTRKRTQTNFWECFGTEKKSANTQECAAPHALSFGGLARRINQYDLPEIH
jgi:hypothetical protein